MKDNLTALMACYLCLLPFSSSIQAAQSIIEVTLEEAPNTSEYEVGNVYRLYVSYNTASLTGQDLEFISTNDITSLHFDFNGDIYDETYDVAASYPRLYFNNFELVAIDYWNTQGLKNRNENSFFTFYQDQSFLYSPNGQSEYAGRYLINSVPEVKTSVLFLSSLGWFILLRRRCT